MGHKCMQNVVLEQDYSVFLCKLEAMLPTSIMCNDSGEGRQKG